MTTWAYKDGQVAIDRCVSASQCLLGTTTKLVSFTAPWRGITGEPEVKVVLVSAGDTGIVQHLNREVVIGMCTSSVRDYLVNPVKAPEGAIYQIAVFVEGADLYWTTEDGSHGYWCQMDIPPFVAGGSGTDYALGAMVAGMSARDAVRVAAMFDHGTNDQIDWANLS